MYYHKMWVQNINFINFDVKFQGFQRLLSEFMFLIQFWFVTDFRIGQLNQGTWELGLELWYSTAKMTPALLIPLSLSSKLSRPMTKTTSKYQIE